MWTLFKMHFTLRESSPKFENPDIILQHGCFSNEEALDQNVVDTFI